MRVRSLIAALALAGAVGAQQNLLRWDGWTIINPQYVHKADITEKGITIFPYSATWVPEKDWPGVEQSFTVATAGFYQVHVRASTWDNEAIFYGVVDERLTMLRWGIQIATTRWLDARTYVIGMRVQPSDFYVNGLFASQPVVRQVLRPTTEVRITEDSTSRLYKLEARCAHVILASPRRIDPIIKLPGFGHGLELDPAAGLIVVALGLDNVFVEWASWSSQQRRHPGNFYLQALSLWQIPLCPPPAFGSRVYVE
jgi:hypothetical protein